MNIQIDEKVKDFLKKKEKDTLTVELQVSDSCCIPASLPHVVMDAPKALEKYDRFEVDGFTVYVYKGAVIKNTLRLVLSNYIFFKEIEIEGIQIL
ncbi:hypothetical protein SAMN02745975_02064 [Geosporobacter subterraneus DSM 17957]|uniref:Fe-S cluster assembly iron-binding protein IscA n=1 Tax=Geosporobacter subterraneus DSM 17957 TaxID=1121919 RepID=A0A1M6J711_9FIRM|nr:CC/Se motif family (seleno)protein [Geosporobacter subterraneus]SHJ42440.1 hypothetical protein SAMN02745975_02064 [Geosporobacter subterraneus DSM 17957]